MYEVLGSKGVKIWMLNRQEQTTKREQIFVSRKLSVGLRRSVGEKGKKS